MMRSMLSKLFVLAVVTMFAVSPALGAEKKESMKAADLQLALRDLWVGHIFWVRNVVFATKSNDADAMKVAEENVVVNAKAIAGAVAGFYGKEAGDKLFGLLAGHYGAVKEYLTASMAMDQAAKAKAVDRLKANAVEIATFLNGANPKNWPKDTLVSLLLAHGGHHISQIDAVLKKDYAAEAATWDAMKMHIYAIADALAGGIVKQFPEKF